MTLTLTRIVPTSTSRLSGAWPGAGEGRRGSAPKLCKSIAECRASFLALIENDSGLVIYGVTTAMGELASQRLDRDERDRHARIKAFAAATSFGDPLPERVVRGIVLARLANFLEGHAATSPRIALAVAAMLDGRPMPEVPGSGQGGAGEILALYPLFAELDPDLRPRGQGARLADQRFHPARRLSRPMRRWRHGGALRLAEQVFALSIEAFRAPLDHYDAALDDLWGDDHEAAALQGLRRYLGPGEGRRNYQAPVSFRIVPRILGQAYRGAGLHREGRGRVSLRSASDNPVYMSRPTRASRSAAASARAVTTTPWRRQRSTISRPSGPISACICDRHGSKTAERFRYRSCRTC